MNSHKRPYSVKEVMQSDALFTIFGEKCLEDHCSENLLFLEHVLHYKSIRDDKERHDKAKYIIQEFLREGSKNEINCRRQTSKTIEDRILQQSEGSIIDAPRNLFDELEKELGLLLKEIIARHTLELNTKCNDEYDSERDGNQRSFLEEMTKDQIRKPRQIRPRSAEPTVQTPVQLKEKPTIRNLEVHKKDSPRYLSPGSPKPSPRSPKSSPKGFMSLSLNPFATLTNLFKCAPEDKQ